MARYMEHGGAARLSAAFLTATRRAGALQLVNIQTILRDELGEERAPRQSEAYSHERSSSE